ncbi:HlyD family efflux transporter periplasmic adaptor subunit [Puniceicoccaceae bacterium K14]|nr:HlyD family efflux transporter periplasmic adaptor subunit [Puniceicoccaceae bacterium K14]
MSDSSATTPEKIQPDDLDFVSDCRAAFLEEKMSYANLAILTIIVFIIAFVAWASVAEVNEITRGQGTIIPVGSTQTVQNLEGGIISEFRVQEGQTVAKGDILLQIDDTAYRAALTEQALQRQSLLAIEARLNAEIKGLETIAFPSEISEQRPDLVAEQIALFEARALSRTTNLDNLNSSLELRSKELEITKPLADKGIVSQIELLRLQTSVSETTGQITQFKNDFLTESIETRNETSTQIAQLEESLKSIQNKITRATVQSPIDGIVNTIHSKNIGAVIRSAEPILEIVPQHGNLVVEADVTPQNIAFIHPGQEVTVKVTAYDFSIYGGLKGKVDHIASNTYTNEKGESFYKIHVSTSDRSLQNADTTLPIIPGMVVEVDILTGKKTVLGYLMKPLLRAKMNALSER